MMNGGESNPIFRLAICMLVFAFVSFLEGDLSSSSIDSACKIPIFKADQILLYLKLLMSKHLDTFVVSIKVCVHTLNYFFHYAQNLTHQIFFVRGGSSSSLDQILAPQEYHPGI